MVCICSNGLTVVTRASGSWHLPQRSSARRSRVVNFRHMGFLLLFVYLACELHFFIAFYSFAKFLHF